MVYFKGSTDKISKGLLALSNMTTKSYCIYSCINKGRITKMRSCIISILFKIFTMLFLMLLCFLLEENLSISITKFNKDYLRMLSEKELKNMNKGAHADKLLESFFEFLKDEKTSLERRAFIKWEDMCFYNNARYSLSGRSWEENKFQKWYDKMQRDIGDFRINAIEEYNKLKDSFSTDEECSCFFKKKRKEWYEYRNNTYYLFKKYVKDCKEELNAKTGRKNTYKYGI
ncbi:Plasmodium exported protein, unknown function [Plasmodium relictum]|uniref:Plasmodium RESA N-terminal domain-containing protein n=1 Tax=Plasmodium relictum TaxID=85471 RepID=A0A1J1GK06_PLARL|nr:Plasmodium exported protein, unknown function [Plasmodium relictum]CRG84434.1 Plasmodium exported protein, unknown function [Plasmodium relictum]